MSGTVHPHPVASPDRVDLLVVALLLLAASIGTRGVGAGSSGRGRVQPR